MSWWRWIVRNRWLTNSVTGCWDLRKEYNLDPGGSVWNTSCHDLPSFQKTPLKTFEAGAHITIHGSGRDGLRMGQRGNLEPPGDLLALVADDLTRTAKSSALLKLPADDQAEDGFLVSGTISSSGQWKCGRPLAERMDIQDPGPLQTPYSLEALDTQGNVISDTPISVDTTKTDPAPFLAMLPRRRTAGRWCS